MSEPQLFVPDLADLLGEIPDDSIVSRTFFQDENYKAILFGFASGQELSEHTAARPAILHILEGEATLTLGDETHEVQRGGLGPYAGPPGAQRLRKIQGGDAADAALNLLFRRFLQ